MVNQTVRAEKQSAKKNKTRETFSRATTSIISSGPNQKIGDSTTLHGKLQKKTTNYKPTCPRASPSNPELQEKRNQQTYPPTRPSLHHIRPA
jgi:hypothetical protein